MGSPCNTASTPLQLTCTPITQSFIGSDISPITDEESFVNTQQTSTPKRYDLLFTIKNTSVDITFHVHVRSVNVEQANMLDEIKQC